MEPHLGDVIGELPPMKPLHGRRYDHPRWLENGTSWIIGAVAMTVFFALIVALIVLAFLFAAQPSLAATTSRDGQTLPWSCQQIRWYASFHSETDLWAKAREYRLTREQIRMARACLTERP